MTHDLEGPSVASAGSQRLHKLLDVLENRGDREEWCEQAAKEIRRLKMSRDEMDAIANGASSLEAESMRADVNAARYMRKYAAVLRGLLERLG